VPRLTRHERTVAPTLAIYDPGLAIGDEEARFLGRKVAYVTDVRRGAVPNEPQSVTAHEQQVITARLRPAEARRRRENRLAKAMLVDGAEQAVRALGPGYRSDLRIARVCARVDRRLACWR
jgi:hypothetical protein